METAAALVSVFKTVIPIVITVELMLTGYLLARSGANLVGR
jgi:hypothetical protein